MTSPTSRRLFLAASGAALFAPPVCFAEQAQPQVPTLLDHILLGCDHLDRGIAFVQQRTGVRAMFGGVHPGAGTQNALLSLGQNRYLEIIAPDPKQRASADSRGLKTLHDEPALVGWAAHSGDIAALAARLKQLEEAIEGPMPGSRKRPDGRVLKWTVLRLKDEPTQLLPFFIAWGRDSIHPSVDSPQGCRLLRFEAITPDVVGLSGKIKELDLDLQITKGRKMYLHAVIEGPKGTLDVAS
jgi:hypothetical protein